MIFSTIRITRPQATLVRSPKTSLLNLKTDSTGDKIMALLPSWLHIQGLRILDGSIDIQDQASDKQYSIRQIAFSLPGPTEEAAEPSLQAMINDSPVFIQGRQTLAADGTTETRLSLQLKKINLQEYRTFLPASLHSVTGLSGTADALFEITLPDTVATGKSPVISGTINTADLSLQTESPSCTLTVPTLQLVFAAQPFKQQYTVQGLTLIAPDIKLAAPPSSTLARLQARLAGFLKSSTTTLTVEQLKIDQGRLSATDRASWQDIRLLLTNFSTTQPGGQAVGLVVQAHRGKNSISFQGQLDKTAALEGNITVQELEVDQLEALKLPDPDIRLQHGTITLQGRLRVPPPNSTRRQWIITDSTLQLKNFTFQDNKQLITGAEMDGSDCTVQNQTPRFFCKELSFSRTDFETISPFSSQAGTTLKSNKNHLFLLDTLLLADSTASIIFPAADTKKTATQIQLNRLRLKLTGMSQKVYLQDNLEMEAAIGAQGRVRITGSVQNNGQANLQIQAVDLALSDAGSAILSRWLAPEVHRGTLQLNGKLKLPDSRFVGSLELDNFLAEKQGGASLGWQRATAEEVTARLHPFSVAVNTITLRQPTIELPVTTDISTALQTFFGRKGAKENLPPAVQQCSIINGRLQIPSASFTDITGTITPLQTGVPAEFNLSGRLKTARWTASGTAGLTDSGQHTVQVTGYPLLTAPARFVDSLGLRLDTRSRADWTISTDQPGWIRLTDIAPTADSELSELLALLTDPENSVLLKTGSHNSAAPADLLGKAVPSLLRQLRLQAVISPRLVLDKSLPELNLPKQVEFLAGEAVPDFMEGLEDYSALIGRRPHLRLVLRGNYAENTDQQHLLRLMQEEADAQRELENLRREQLRARLQEAEDRQPRTPVQLTPDRRLRQIQQAAELEPLPPKQVQLPEDTLNYLARQRAEVLRSYLVDTLHIPPDKVVLRDVGSGGTTTDILLQATW
jgi:hypothetical protein